MVKLGFFIFSLFKHIFKKLAHSLLVHGHSSCSTFGLHPSEGCKGFVNWFFKKSDHRSWTWSWTMEKGHLPLYNFMVHGVNWP
jgi:hypothetical protein